jgi:hypothetical protein
MTLPTEKLYTWQRGTECAVQDQSVDGQGGGRQAGVRVRLQP